MGHDGRWIDESCKKRRYDFGWKLVRFREVSGDFPFHQAVKAILGLAQMSVMI